MSAFDLSERVAVVTGGNAGIGLGIAQGLGEAGARVMICGRRDAANDAAIEILRSAGCDAHSIAIDVTDRDQLHTLFAHTRETLGPVDILVNNAGIFRGGEPETFESSDWEAVLDTNLSQVVYASQLAFADLASSRDRGGQGKVINIGSMYSLFGSPSSIAYAASKGGIVQLTKSLATAWAQYGVNVNAILPGWIETDMTAPINDQPEMMQQIVSRTPFGRMGRINEMAGASVFLASTASDFVTGVSLPVDGGYSVA